MSTDYETVCDTCKLSHHLGQRMGGTHSFGYGSKDTEGQRKCSEFVDNHVGLGHSVRIVESENVPDGYQSAEAE